MQPRTLQLLILIPGMAYALNSNAKPTSRVSSSVHFKGNFHVTDSTVYDYPNKLYGGDAMHTIMYSIDSQYKYTTSFNDTGIKFQFFDGANNIIRDSQIVNNGSGWVNSSINTYKYDVSGKMLMQFTQTWNGTAWVNADSNTWVYDGSENLIQDTYMYWNGTSWSSKYDYRDSMAYNSSNQIVYSIRWTFNTATSTFTNANSRTMYTYAGGFLDSSVYQAFYFTSWVNSTKDVYTHSAAGAVLTDTSFKAGFGGGAWVYAGVDIDSNNASSNLVIDVYKNYYTASKLFSNSTRLYYHYNDFGQIDTIENQTVSGAYWGFSGNEKQSVYHYAVDSATGIAPVTKAAGNMQVYPVPANNFVNINIAFDEPQSFSVAIYDAQGRAVRQYHEAATAASNRTIPVNNLAAGNYFIQVTGENGRLSRQFIVAH